MIRIWSEFWTAQGRFWFNPDLEEGLKRDAQFLWFRRVFGTLLFIFYCLRTPDLILFYSDSGIAPLSFAPDIFYGEGTHYTLLSIFSGNSSLWIFHFILLLALAVMVLGILPRLSALIALVMHVSFLHRNMAVAYGVDLIVCHYLFYLFLAGGPGSTPTLSLEALGEFPGAQWAWLGQRFVGRLRSISFRLCQIQVCLIYGYSGLQKARGVLWWKGEALWYALTNSQYTRWDFSGISHLPLLIGILTIFTALWEIYFPALVWLKPFRRWILTFGVCLHLGIAVTMQIPFFAGVMVSTYVFFLTKEELELIFRRNFRYLQKPV